MDIEKYINGGVVFKSLDGVFIDNDVEIGEGTIIHSGNHIEKNTVIGKNVVLHENNLIENSIVEKDCTLTRSIVKNSKIGERTSVGPYANVHSGSKIGKECRIGNFVEIKNSSVGSKTKIAHLAYVGDADIGDLTNVGCGSIFVNYDGKNKHRSRVGNSVFIGSNSNIIAPVTIEDNAYIAAGTTVTVDLPPDCLCIGRNRETIKENRSKYYKNVFTKKYFGTDGIRGIYGEFLTDDIAYMVGNYLGYSADGGQIVVGRDNRISGTALAEALTRGITDTGCNVINLSMVGTPVVAYATEITDSNYGVMITASHNPRDYNGIKIFNYDGRKLTDLEELEIENHIDKDSPVIVDKKDTITDGKEYCDSYCDYLADIVPTLVGKKIVLDLSNGALSGYARRVFETCGAEIISIGNNPDGNFINHGCGALFPDNLASKVIEEQADIGFSFDGDGDRIIVADRTGRIIDGDEILYVIADYLSKHSLLKNNTVVGTVMTNKGIEIALKNSGITLLRTPVGDHNIIEKMISKNLSLGGEQSGHIIISDILKTGDGLATAAFILKIIAETGLELSEYNRPEIYPTLCKNIVTENNRMIEKNENVKNYIKTLEREYGDAIRIILRASGTEPKLRIAVESKNKSLAEKIIENLTDYVLKIL